MSENGTQNLFIHKDVTHLGSEMGIDENANKQTKGDLVVAVVCNSFIEHIMRFLLRQSGYEVLNMFVRTVTLLQEET